MLKAIVVAVGDTPLKPFNDLLKQNTISTNAIDAATNSVDEIDKLIQADEQCQCVLLKGISSFSQHIPRIADATEKLVLLYCSPATALGNALEVSNGTVKPEQVINVWQESVSQAMELVEESDFYSLCDLHDTLEHSSLFLKEFFGIEKAVESKPSTYTKKQFANHLATLYLFEQDNAFALYDEALSIGKLFGEFTVHLGPDTDEIKQSATDSGQSVFEQLISNHQEIQSKHNEIESLKAQSSEKVNALEKQIGELQHVKAALEESSIQVQEELTRNKALAEQQAIKIEALQESKQNIESKFQATTAQIEKSQNEMTAFASELSAKEASLTESQERLTNLQSQLQGKEQRNTQLQSQIEQLKEQLANQQSDIEEKDKECKATKNSLQEAQQQLQSANARFTELEAQKSELTSTIEQLEEQLQSKQIVIEKKQEAITLKESAIKEYENQLDTSHQQISQLATNLVELQAQQKEVIASKDIEYAALSNSLTQAQTALEETTNSLVKLKDEKTVTSQEFELTTLQVAQLQEELECTFSELQQARATEFLHEETCSKLSAVTQQVEQLVQEKELAELKISQLQEELESAFGELQQARAREVLDEETRSKLSAVTQQVEQLVQEKELAELKISQLQEELESTFAELQQARAREVLDEETRSKLSAVTQQVEQLVQENELAELKISQLQEELELITVQNYDLEAASSLNENVIAEKSQQIDLLTQKNEEHTAQSYSLKQQVEAATKRKGLEEQALINELQAQLERQLKQTQLLENNNARLQEQMKQSEAGMSKNNEFQQVELELASLQIGQLQEELEYYYNAWQEAQQNGTQVFKMGKHHQKVFSKAQAESLVVTGKYSEDGYQDAHFMLNNVLLGDGRSFAELPVKLVRVGEHIAIEFRDEEQGGLFQHFEDATDEHGPYLRYSANSSESILDQQAHIYSRMNASERVLVMSTIALLAELMQEQDISCSVNLSSEEWRAWRLLAIELVEIVEQQPNWLSFDSVALKEEYRTDGYEHLWLSFENVLVGEFWKEYLELKVAATGVNEGDTEAFCNDISLEFREASDGTPPLLTWPAETEDEYGPKYLVSISNLNEVKDLASTDKTLIFHLINNLPSIIDKFDERGAAMSRSRADWKAASLLKLENVNKVQEVIQQEEQPRLIVEEVISMGSYQHLLFVSEYQETKIKLKAQNINSDTFDAELFIELRTGTAEIIYNDTEFFGEDEFGPRVLIPAETFFGDLITSRISEFEWIIREYDKAIYELEEGEGIDELVKRLWLNMLKRKKEII